MFFQLLMTPWLIILMKNFAKSVPFEITESGKIDGAGDFRIFISLVLPMLKPALATVGLFLALGYWNEWYLSSCIWVQRWISNRCSIICTISLTRQPRLRIPWPAQPSLLRTFRQYAEMATAVVATGPIVFLLSLCAEIFYLRYHRRRCKG